MKYGDSLSEPPPTSHMFDAQICPPIKPRDSESYGSLHTDDQLEDATLDRFKDVDEFGQTEVKNTHRNVDGLDCDSHVDTEEQHSITTMETNCQSKHTRTKFCVVL